MPNGMKDSRSEEEDEKLEEITFSTNQTCYLPEMSRCPSTGEWINKMWHSHTMRFIHLVYEIMYFVGKQVELGLSH